MSAGWDNGKNDNGKMKRWLRRGILVGAAVCMAAAGAGTAMAEDRERIEDITLHIETGIEVGNGSWEVDVITDDDDYSVDGAEIMNPASEWAGGMIPKIRITLTADDGYYFAGTGSDMFSLSGEGAEYVSASREDDNTVLNLVIRLDKLEGGDLSVSSAWWNKSSAAAQWDRAQGAKYYQLRLYRGSSLVTSVSTRSGSDCEYSFIGSMGSSGRYYFEVRAVGAGSETGDWERSDSWNLSSSDTGSLRSGGTSDSEEDDFEDDRVFNTSNSSYSEDDEGDDEDPGDDDYGSSGGPGAGGSSGKTVSSSDSSGPGGGGSGVRTLGSPGTSGTSETSEEEDEADGRTATVSSGVRGTSRDSYSSGKSGSGGITSGGENCWYKDEGGWWYHLENGRYPYNTWELIDGQWYCFGETGYVYHGWVNDGDQWYFCDLQSGAMLMNTQTPDGFYVGGDGAWIR